MQKAVITENAAIINKLKYGKAAKTLTTYTALSSSINIDLDPASLYNTVIVTNQDGFDYLDKQLDQNRRPILQPDPTNATVKRFKGFPVIVFSNAQFPSDQTYGAPVFYGNLEEGVKFVTCGYYKFATSSEAGFTSNTTLARLIELFDVVQWDSDDACYCFGYLGEAVNPKDASLSGLTIGSLTLTPAFNAAVYEYTATTENASNKITATPTDENAEITIMVGEAEIENEGTATWETGENVVTVTVTNGTAQRIYTVTVTKS